MLHQLALVHIALARCDVMPLSDPAAQVARSLLAADRFGALDGVVSLLDW